MYSNSIYTSWDRIQSNDFDPTENEIRNGKRSLCMCPRKENDGVNTEHCFSDDTIYYCY